MSEILFLVPAAAGLAGVSVFGGFFGFAGFTGFTGFTGLPGTGKTILLYDIAMQLSVTSSVCVLHFGSHEKELEHLDERLKRVDFYYCDNDKKIELKKEYSAILVDEGHRLTAANLK